ncbi:flagellar type III secretion system protein FlhB [Paracoccus onubensis]|uniref:flagellar type III secretion system protein FlhB n=1 Tax=Paracoccus onubensis TaxID=1675788 RepID=UPI0027305F93|nr:flagellar type III secretion system protein FlhB [Paracoccus onubensis]MDP0925760.1 flagellar type III secretion system protein FlhB [Paracoccus onubensis]
MSEEKDEKPFEPSERKLQKARKDGDVPRSTEVNVLGMYLGAWLVLTIGAGVATREWLASASRALGSDAWLGGSVVAIAMPVGGFAAVAVIGLMMVPFATIFIALLAQRGLVFSVKKIAFDPKRLNPIRNAGQKFGPAGLVTFGISVLKAAFVCLGGWYLFSSLLNHLAATMSGAGNQWIPGLRKLLQDVVTMAVAISALFAVIDLLWKRHEYLKRHRMTRKELDDENKDTEGDPHIKAARRQKAIDLAMKQMLSDVARADVVIVNPTHYAVALEWKRGSGRAPVCLAKGTDDLAARIRDKARAHDVPIHSDPPCARALHATVGIGEEIRREHFAAVAIAIRFAEKMRQKARAGW